MTHEIKREREKSSGILFTHSAHGASASDAAAAARPQRNLVFSSSFFVVPLQSIPECISVVGTTNTYEIEIETRKFSLEG